MDFRRMIRGRQFWLAVLAALAGLLLGTAWPEWKENTAFPSGTFLSMAKDSLQSRIVLFVIPVAAVLPWGEEYIKERQWNFLRILVVRKGKMLYGLDRVINTAVSGTVVWVLAASIQLLFFFLLFFWREEVFVWSWELWEEYLTLLGRVGLTASCMASLGGICGVLSGSVYLAMGLPFVVYFFMMILRERYLENLYCLDPGEWIRGKAFWGSGQRGLWVFLILLCILLATIHGMVLGKRLEEL